MDESDEKLIKYLAKHSHSSPFRHAMLSFHIKMPEFLARQTYKHVVGISYTEGPPPMHVVDHGWNEISLRYIDASNLDFYCPTKFRKQAEKNKQASTDETIDPTISLGEYPAMSATNTLKHHNIRCSLLYKELINAGIAREQARTVLPLNFYTEFYWTISLQAFAHFLNLRKHTGAQYEIRQYADALETLGRELFPVSLGVLINE